MKLVYSPEAVRDFADILDYGRIRFGKIQADRYSQRLLKSLDVISRNPEIGPKRLVRSREVRIHPSGAHLIIYDLSGDGIRLVRLLPARQNIADHI